MNFYTWGDINCCLPQGATEATLLGSLPESPTWRRPHLQEVIGPQTGNPADADIRHRCAVRLTPVLTQNSRGKPLVDPLFDGSGDPIISASQTPSPSPKSSGRRKTRCPSPSASPPRYLDENADAQTVTNVSVAFGNIVLADHGLTLTAVTSRHCPRAIDFLPQRARPCCTPAPPTPVPVRYPAAGSRQPPHAGYPRHVVALPGAGNPVTPGVMPFVTRVGVPRSPTPAASSALTLQTTNPTAWPTFFGVSRLQG